MAILGYITRRPRIRRSPPERFHLFVSYTIREDETRIIKPIVDHFLNSILRPLIEQTIGEPPAFYDGYTLYHPAGSGISTFALENVLRFAIEESEVLVAFVSPAYVGSKWCRFECRAMVSKKLRPWFDLCRLPPISQLQDHRLPSERPDWWECVLSRFLMWQRRLHGRPSQPGGAIVAVRWKGDLDPIGKMPELVGVPLFDWTSCLRAFEASERLHSHLLRHGSVSPAWEEEAKAAGEDCCEAMSVTAKQLVAILQERRLRYAHSK